ncbi:MAG: hypothetical protein JNK22_07675 [Rhodocyclaceae bacterium]|nr:hypothetical protein [Rhodocyclaceae bacterium]
MPKTSFKPSVHGWPFDNFGKFGNCGGMCFAALDRYYGGEAVDRSISQPSVVLRKEIEGRQADTLDDWLWGKVIQWTQRPDEGHGYRGHSVGHMTQHDEWPKVRSSLDAGQPITLCLIRVEGFTANPAGNHQVTAWDYTLGSNGHVVVAVYDPNHAGDDRVSVEFDLGRNKINARQSTGESVRGFFGIRYDRDINVHVHSLAADGTVGHRTDQRAWSAGWTQALPFSVNNANYLFLLKWKNGRVHVHKLEAGGMIGALVTRYDWSANWTSICAYRIKNRSFLLLLKESNGIIHVHEMNGDGTVGRLSDTRDWSDGWTLAKAFSVRNGSFLFLLKGSTGEAHVHALWDDGRIGQEIVRYDWSSGWTSAEFFEAGGETYLFLLKAGGGTVHVHRMNSDGTVGLQVASRDWTGGWTSARIFAVQGRLYLLALKYLSGEVHLHAIGTDGRVGNQLARYDWSPGWTAVETFDAGNGPFLLLLKHTQSAERGWFPDIPFV